ncbi:MAG: HlyD family efflux transporter periplasmic adaptor subunit [Clostridiales Family XIII bacterium]|jgi:HlyD family secretion protein|nr:HlyD family efflux transporter periplasmic adaptor subunit [Clostridiales Family XIII bacterium]
MFTKRRGVTIAVVAVVAVCAILFGGRFLFSQKAEALEYTEFTVTRGDITVSLSGSGTLAPVAQYEVVSLVGGEVLSDTFREGDSVEKGQLLYTFDTSEMQNSLERANLSLEKSRMNYEKVVASHSGLVVTAPIAGRVAELYVQEGDNVNTGGRVAKVVDDRKLTARIPFSEGDAAQLRAGQSVRVTVENTFEVLDGAITKVYDSSRIADGYVTVKDVDISVENPGLLSAGTFVSVEAGGLSSYEGGELKGGTEKVVTAQAGGMVEKLHVLTGENIGAGAPIAALSSDTAADSLKEGYLSLREAELSYENAAKQLADYELTAPISGSVISKSVKAGDSLETSTKTVMAVIADMSEMSFTINVDELDIAKVKAGQQAIITVDALAGQVFSGAVDNVGILGTSSNGVTTYPVKIKPDRTDGLWPGMNATATIVVDSVRDVLMIPVTAVNRGSLALVKGGTAAEEEIDQSEAPDGAVYMRVETGLNNENFIEVKGGLSEGDVVLAAAAQATALQQNTMMVMGPGMARPGMGGAGTVNVERYGGPPSGTGTGGQGGTAPSGGSRPAGGGG